jgi:glycosyltransferase involved in cell wall biosynthesis
MLITIGIPVWNGERFLEEAVRSALAQTHSDLEVLISDNGSTDRTPELCARLAAQDARVRVLRSESNLGAAANFNGLVHEARGEFFWWLPHDDRLRPEAVSSCLRVLTEHPEVLSCHPRTQAIDAEGQPITARSRSVDLRSPSPALRLGRFLIKHSKCDGVLGLHRLAGLRETGLIRPYRGGDEVLYAELALRGPVWEHREALFERRVHEGSSLAQGKAADEVTAWFDPAAQIEIRDVGRFLRARFLETITSLELAPAQSALARLEVWRWWCVRGLRIRRKMLRDAWRRMGA